MRGKSLEMRWRLMVITISMRLQYALLYETLSRFFPHQGREMETPFRAADLVNIHEERCIVRFTCTFAQFTLMIVICFDDSLIVQL